MVKVFIWNYRGKEDAWGHASLQVRSHYISWWPSQPGQVPSGIHRNIYSSMPILDRKFSDDIRAEKQMPDHNILISGLDEQSIIEWWIRFGMCAGFQGPPLPWKTLSLNCSTVVATALKKGGGDKYASWLPSWNIVWKPSDVLQYATSIKVNISS